MLQLVSGQLCLIEIVTIHILVGRFATKYYWKSYPHIHWLTITKQHKCILNYSECHLLPSSPVCVLTVTGSVFIHFRSCTEPNTHQPPGMHLTINSDLSLLMAVKMIGNVLGEEEATIANCGCTQLSVLVLRAVALSLRILKVNILFMCIWNVHNNCNFVSTENVPCYQPLTISNA